MKIETRIISIEPYKIEVREGHPTLVHQRLNLTHTLTPVQEIYLNRLAQGKSIAMLTNESVAAGEVFSFRELFQLLTILIKLTLLNDIHFKEYFQMAHGPVDEDSLAPKFNKGKVTHWTERSLIELPFFRNLPRKMQDIFVAKTKLMEVSERTKVIAINDTDRDLYAILDGEASIYTQGPKHRNFITSLYTGSVFGEGGFFFNRPRSADVIINKYSILARVHFDEQSFGPFLQENEIGLFQQRLWMLHGLLSSRLFQNAPSETMDQFVNMGTLRPIKFGEFVVKEGEEGKTFFVIIQGKLNVIRHNLVVNSLKQGDIFGEIALLCEFQSRTATVRAESDGLLMEVSHKNFYEALSQNIFLAKEIEEIAHRRESSLLL